MSHDLSITAGIIEHSHNTKSNKINNSGRLYGSL